VIKDCADCPELVVIPAGSFTMGGTSGDDAPAHTVTIRQAFAMGKTEITRGQFAAFVNATGYNAGDECFTYEGGKWEKRSGRNWRNSGLSQDDNHPVVCINWNDAKAYTEWLSRKTGKSYQLPTESQWEYTCRAGQQTEYCGGNNVAAVAWYNANSGSNTHSVGQKQANAFGLYDMSGSVWEWTQDTYHANYNGAPNDGSEWQGDDAKRVLRGGSWLYPPDCARSAYRFGYSSTLDTRHYGFGFRVSRTLP
jgi:formylglycine-generating enzyme required for sulfatase activity